MIFRSFNSEKTRENEEYVHIYYSFHKSQHMYDASQAILLLIHSVPQVLNVAILVDSIS